MKRPTSCFLIAIFILSLALTPIRAQHTFKTTSQSVIGYLEYVPKDYASNSNKYPIVIFLHGYGERGPNSTDPAILKSAVWSVAKNGPPKYVQSGTQFPFILISPQLKSAYNGWPAWYILEVINEVKSSLRVDEKRIHVTGFSMGGGGTWTALQEYPRLFASGSPMCGGNNSPAKACGIASESVPVWAFHGDQDAVVPLSRSVNMVNAINSCSPAPNPRAKLTIYPGVKHTAWFRSYATDYTYHKPNLYDWIMAQNNTRTGSNTIPTANAGADVSLSAASTLTLRGSATDPDGSIVAWRWSKIAGPAVTLSPSGSSLVLSGLKAGTYHFRLQVTDNGGATDSDYVRVVIGSSTTTSTTPTTTTTTTTSATTTSSNTAPVANAGPNVKIVLPVNSAVLNGSASDKEGSISSYAWSKISGGAVTMTGGSTSRLSLGGLVQGTYVFRLTVRDNAGATDTDDVAVYVNASTTSTTTTSATSTTTTTTTTTKTVSTSTNKIPIANAGSDRIIRLPLSSVSLSGTGSDADGSIASYSWAQISGPRVSITSSTTSKPVLSNLLSGECVFRLTVKDNSGATSYDDVKITFSFAPVANAGPNINRTSRTGFSITGSGTDKDGTITRYQWTKTSGPSVTLSGQGTSKLSLSNLAAGNYYFRLTVTDNTGLTHSDNMLVVVP